MLAFWILVVLLAFGYEKLKKIEYQRDYDNNPYVGAFKSERWLRENGLTKRDAALQAAMRRIMRNGWAETPEQLTKKMLCHESLLCFGEEYGGLLEYVKEHWDCLREMDEKPQYRHEGYNIM